MHFYESSILTTKDGLYCQVYSNEHPDGKIIVKPKYIPTDKISSDALPYRFISGRKMNRLNMWISQDKLKEYVEEFSKTYPDYVFESDVHKKSPLFFAIPKEMIDKTYSPSEGLSELMSIPSEQLDPHLKTVFDLVSFLLESDLELSDLGITYSTLMGHYSPNVSDINIVVYGKEKFWKLMNYLEKNEHKDLRWKTYEEWESFYSKRNRHMIHKKEKYIENMDKKKSEGFFRDTLFIIFAVENEGETWFSWGSETYEEVGFGTFTGTVTDNMNSVVRPGYFSVESSSFASGDDSCKDISISKVVFHSRDYCMLASSGEQIEMSGVVEKVTPKSGDEYYRLVVGYFDAYISDRRDKEYIKVL